MKIESKFNSFVKTGGTKLRKINQYSIWLFNINKKFKKTISDLLFIIKN